MSERLTTAIDRLASQFDDRINILALLEAVITQFDETDNMLNDLLLLRTMELAEGVWLDNVGEIVGIKRPSEEVLDQNRFAYCSLSASPGSPRKGFSSLTHDPTNPSRIFKCGDFETNPSRQWTVSAQAILVWDDSNPYEGFYCGKIVSSAVEAPVFLYIQQSTFAIGQSYGLKGVAQSDGIATPIIKHNGFVLWSGSLSTDWQPFEFDTGALDVNSIEFGFELTEIEGGEFVRFDVLTLENGRYSSLDGLPTGVPITDTTYRNYIRAKAIATYTKPTIRNIYAYIQNAFDVACKVYNDELPGYVIVELEEFLNAAERRLLTKYAPLAASVKVNIINWPEE